MPSRSSKHKKRAAAKRKNTQKSSALSPSNDTGATGTFPPVVTALLDAAGELQRHLDTGDGCDLRLGLDHVVSACKSLLKTALARMSPNALPVMHQHKLLMDVVEGKKQLKALEKARKKGLLSIEGLRHVDPEDEMKRTLMWHACWHMRLDVADWLKKRGAAEDVRTPRNDGVTPLCWACVVIKQQRVMEWLYKSGANDDVGVPDNKGRTPLWSACFDGNLDIVKWLHAHGANVRAPNKEGMTPMWIAAQEQHVNVMDWLCKNGAEDDVNVPDDEGRTPLWFACLKGNLEVVKWLHARGANVRTRNEQGMTPMFVAAQEKQVNVMEWLCKNGAEDNLDTPAMEGRTPLWDACFDGNLDIVKWLHAHGANVRTQSKDGATPMWVAAQEKHMEVMEWLYKNGAKDDVDTPKTNGNTPLYFACQSGFLKIAQWLHKRGADPCRVSKHGWTPIKLAAQNGHKQMVRWLHSVGALVDVSVFDEAEKGAAMLAANGEEAAKMRKNWNATEQQLEIKSMLERKLCAHCQKCEYDAQRCAVCGLVSYCDATCQAAHWKRHKKACREWKKEKEKKRMMAEVETSTSESE